TESTPPIISTDRADNYTTLPELTMQRSHFAITSVPPRMFSAKCRHLSVVTGSNTVRTAMPGNQTPLLKSSYLEVPSSPSYPLRRQDNTVGRCSSVKKA
ncbi:MAG: hypothetical protein ACK56F_21035, partial [bacterium]